MLTMTRYVAFSAAKTEWLPTRSPEENARLLGADARPEPAGHNYVLAVSVRGGVNARTGMVVNIKDIDRILQERVVQVLDKRHVNQRIPLFHERPATVEALAAYIAAELENALPHEVTLTSVRLEETPLRFAEKRPLEEVNMQLTHVYEFAASHRLHSPHLTPEENRAVFGKCNHINGHGHNYILEVTVSGEMDSLTGRVLDPNALDEIVNREIVMRYDHRNLNADVPELAGAVPTSEVVTVAIWNRLRPHIPSPTKLHRVLLRETARNLFEYYGEENESA